MPESAYSATSRFFSQHKQAYRRLVIRCLDLRIHRAEIKIELPGVLGLECRSLELHHYIALQARVIEQQVDKKFIAAHIELELLADKRKPGAQLQQEPRDVANQRVLNVAFVRLITAIGQQVAAQFAYRGSARQSTAYISGSGRKTL